MQDRPSRKSPRLKGFDYSSFGVYALTINSYKYEHIFGRVEFGQIGNTMHLSDIGQIIDKVIHDLQKRFPEFELLNYSIMPNHVHLLISKSGENDEKKRSISDYISALKSLVYKDTRKLYPNRPIWHSRFYDRIIRNDDELEKYWQYIEFNVDKWEKDLFFNPLEDMK